MAWLRSVDDFGYEGEMFDPFSYGGPSSYEEPSKQVDLPPEGTFPSGGYDAPQQAPAPTAAPAPTGGFDREQFKNAWQSSSGSLSDFIKKNPQFSTGVKVGGTYGDIGYLPTGEVLDLTQDSGPGGRNSHGWQTSDLEPRSAAQQNDGQGGSAPPPQISAPPPQIGALSGSQNYGGGGSQASYGYANQGPQGQAPKPDFSEMLNQLKGLFPGGMFNQGIVNQRTDIARDALNRYRNQQNATNRAALANRGLLGSGPEATAQNLNEENIGGMFQNAVSGIQANESEAADRRMMQALQLATGLTADQAGLMLDSWKAQSGNNLGYGQLALGNRNADIESQLGNRGYDVQSQLGNRNADISSQLGNRNADITNSLGLGNLALGNLSATNSYNLGLGDYGLNRDRLGYDMEHGDTQQLIDILGQLYGGATTASGGYV